MSVAFFNQEWLSQNGQRSYPIATTASKTDTTGDLTLPDSIILSLYLTVHFGLNAQADKFFLRQIGVFSNGLIVEVGYDDGSEGGTTAASAVISISNHREYQSYALTGQGDFAETNGQIVLGSKASLEALPSGVYQFSPEAGQLEVDCIRPALRSVHGLIFTNGTESTEVLTGVIEFVTGRNTRYSVTQNGSINQVRIDAISGEGLNEDCVCEETLPCVKTINGIGPDNNQNIDLVGDACFSIDSSTGLIRVTDECSSPCCGCPELEAITQDLDLFREQANTLNGIVNRLETETKRTELTILGLKIRDRGCLEVFE